MKTLRELLFFSGGVFLLYFLPFALICIFLGFTASLIWDIHWAWASFIAFLGVQAVFGFLDVVTEGAIGFRRWIKKIQK